MEKERDVLEEHIKEERERLLDIRTYKAKKERDYWKNIYKP